MIRNISTLFRRACRFESFSVAVLTLTVALLAGCSTDLSSPTADVVLGSTSVAVHGQVSLDGSGSSDPNHEALAYQWRLASAPPGSHAAVADPSATTTWVAADVAGSYTVELVVSDGALTSKPATATFTAGPCGGNAPTITSVTAAPALPSAGDSVLLSATATDAVADASCGAPASLTFAWSLVAVPAGSRASLNDASLANPSLFTDVPGVYQVQVVVTDPNGNASVPSMATVVVTGCPSVVPEVFSVTASSSSPHVGERVALSAIVGARGAIAPTTNDADGGAFDTSSTDAAVGCDDAALFTYHWALVSVPPGSAAAPSSAGVRDPSFTADLPGVYVANLSVTNADGRTSNTKTVTIVAGKCGSHAPAASVTATPSAPAIGQVVALSATVTDADTAAPCSEDRAFFYLWSMTALPAGSTAQLNDPTLPSPSFTVDVAGTYSASVVVLDAERHESAVATATVVGSNCGANAPAVTSVTASPAAPDTGSVVTLGASVSDADTAAPCSVKESFTQTWTLTSVPSGSTATLSGAHQTTPWFVADVPGTYVVEARATDTEGLTSAAKSLTVTASSCGSAAPSVNAINVGPTSPVAGSGVTLTAQVTDADTTGTCKQKETFSYAWALTTAPAGSAITLTSSDAPLSGFVADKAGTYAVSLVVTDGEGHASAAAAQTITVTAASTCGQGVPVARLASFTAGACGGGTCSGAVSTPAVTSTPNATPPGYTIALNGHPSVRLDASASSDPDNAAPCSAGQTLSYAWSILAVPVGSAAHWSIGTGATTTLAAPTFVPDLPGIYQVGLVVSDGVQKSSALVVQIGS